MARAIWLEFRSLHLLIVAFFNKYANVLDGRDPALPYTVPGSDIIVPQDSPRSADQVPSS